MNGFRKDFNWQMRFIPTVKSIVGPLLLVPAPLDIDLSQATDLIILHGRAMNIGCRIRRAEYIDRYPHEFTIRLHRDTGAKTELAKIVDGWGDWLFYGFAYHDEMTDLGRWHIVDLHALRANLIRNPARVKPKRYSNGDGTHFVAFDIRVFPANPPILIADSHPFLVRPAA